MELKDYIFGLFIVAIIGGFFYANYMLDSTSTGAFADNRQTLFDCNVKVSPTSVTVFPSSNCAFALKVAVTGRDAQGVTTVDVNKTWFVMGTSYSDMKVASFSGVENDGAGNWRARFQTWTDVFQIPTDIFGTSFTNITGGKSTITYADQFSTKAYDVESVAANIQKLTRSTKTPSITAQTDITGVVFDANKNPLVTLTPGQIAVMRKGQYAWVLSLERIDQVNGKYQAVFRYGNTPMAGGKSLPTVKSTFVNLNGGASTISARA